MKIKGNTVGTPIPRSNFNQTDPKKADYLVGRENIVGKDNLASVTEEILAQAKASGEFNGSDGKDGVNGKDGTSVAITGITESDEDGGENVVTFSDGKTLTVKNGNKGGDGEGGGGNSVYFSEEEPTDAKTGDFWYDESEGESEGGGASVQANMEQNNPSAPDYIKNRTHYEEVTQESIEGVELSWNIGQDHDTIPFELGQTWDFYLYNARSGNWINWNYSGANDEGHYPVQQATDGTFYIGDPNVNAIPFYITTTSSALNGSFENMNNATKLKIVGVSGTKTTTIVHKLDSKYLPENIYLRAVWNDETGNADVYIMPEYVTEDKTLEVGKLLDYETARDIVGEYLKGAKVFIGEELVVFGYIYEEDGEICFNTVFGEYFVIKT